MILHTILSYPNNTRVCYEHLFGQVSTSTGCNQTCSWKDTHAHLFTCPVMDDVMSQYMLTLETRLTQSKSKTIITRSMLTISLIVFTDKLQGHVHTFYSKWYFITIYVTEFTI